MKKGLALILAAAMAVPGVTAFAPAIAHAQGNDNDYTPLNSRIRRERQFPTEPRSTFAPRQLTEVGRQRSRNMADSFARCLWDRSNEKGRDYLNRSDLGLVAFEQMGMTVSEIPDLYPIQTCLSRVANINNSGVRLSYNADSMRRWYLQAAYLDLYPEGPAWLVPGNTVAERVLPLSANNPTILAVLEFSDCLVAIDPNAADYLFRTPIDSAEEDAAVQQLIPVMSECLPADQTLDISASQLRVWIGEADVYSGGKPHPENEQDAHLHLLQKHEVVIGVDLAAGHASAEAWTCDYSADYVRINADYRS